MGRVIPFVVGIGLTIYAFIDCLQTEKPNTFPKWVWLIVIVCVPVLGPLLWLIFGHFGGGGWGRDDDKPLAPDDDPTFFRDFDRSR